MGKKKKNKNQSSPDIFARITGVLGLVLAIVAIVVPIWQQSENDKERLKVWMRPNSAELILLSDNRKRSRVVKVPWLFTLSNTGKVKLSVTGYDVLMMENGGLSRFSHMVGLAKNFDESKLEMPITLDAGESKTIKMYLGFRANEVVLEHLYTHLKKVGPFTLSESVASLAKHGLTIYGGKATFKEIDGSTLVTIDSEFYKNEPVYRVEFTTGRNESFFIQGSETISKLGR